MLVLVGKGFQLHTHVIHVHFFHHLGATLCIAQGHVGLLGLLVAQIGYRNLVTGTVLGNLFLQTTHLVGVLSGQFHNDIALLEAGFLCGTSICNLVNVHSAYGSEVYLVALCFLHINVVAYVSSLHAQYRTLHHAIGFEVGHYLIHNGGGDGESVTAITTSLAVNHGIDAYKLASFVDQSATAVTRIDGSIGLDETLDTVCAQRAGLVAYHTSSYGAGKIEGIAHSQYPLT